ncbi:MAG: hypothetical protein D6800_00380 [Candidatus Zixiibacteriota bacterium]|nr:MAG: hypothetical protein D6800_00380 [candidate division Zixibacteria bacterium]
MRTVIISALASILVGAGVYVWVNHTWEERYDDAVTDVVSTYQWQVDSLSNRIEVLNQELMRSIRAEHQKPTLDEYGKAMANEIHWLRAQLTRLVKQTVREAGVDPIRFYLSKLGDSTFVSHYGDFDKPLVFRIAAEELGEIGKPAIPPLIGMLDTTTGYTHRQVLYALLLAAQHNNVVAFTRGDYPPDKRRKEYQGIPIEQGWHMWFDKYRDHWR